MHLAETFVYGVAFLIGGGLALQLVKDWINKGEIAAAVQHKKALEEYKEGWEKRRG